MIRSVRFFLSTLAVCIVFICIPVHGTLFAASFGFAPNATDISVGEQFSVEVYTNTTGMSVNAISGTVKYMPGMFDVVSVRKSDAISFWVKEPKAENGSILFEGIALDPGVSGPRVPVLTVILKAKQSGVSEMKITNASILKNDGLGTNVLNGLASLQLKVRASSVSVGALSASSSVEANSTPLAYDTFALPVITDYSAVVSSGGRLFVKGKGEPNALTLIQFKKLSPPTFGQRMLSVMGDRESATLSDVYVINSADGSFEYVSSRPVSPGLYSAIPSLVGNGIEKKTPGLGAQVNVIASRKDFFLAQVVDWAVMLIPVMLLAVLTVLVYRKKQVQ